MEALKKMGRPRAEKPKNVQYGIRLDDETEKKLDAYCTRKGITKAQAFRRGIELLFDED